MPAGQGEPAVPRACAKHAVGQRLQPFSAAGKRGGADDTRHLWPKVARVIAECRPEWVLLENVAGHVTL
ncbi:MAG: DNA cytosine methyltransferase, partial [Rhodobacteraceae bacterium]|nr:DNA cytosine methyltransferase [Paracoccaceae bacterium]